VSEQVKVGDKVWVLCEVIEPCENLIKVTPSGNDNWFWAGRGQCRPVEPPVVPDLSTMCVEVVSDLGSQVVKPSTKEPTRGQKLAEQALKGIWAANDAVNETPVIKDCLTTESNSPKILDGSIDPINPSHYKQGGIECIEAIKAATGDGFIGYVWGNVLKYLWRWPKKGGVDDLKKARWYLDRLIQEVSE
jgi:hypothetical protein